jgi:tetratricopeptide (TPR) repeat protein
MILNNFAYSLAERGLDLDRALKMVQKAVDEEPENSSYLDTIGWVYYKLGNYEKAKEFIFKAIEQDGNNATLLDHLGDIFYKMGNIEKANEYWNSSLELDDSNKEIQTKIEKGLD